MDDTARIINLLKQQKYDLETLYNNSKGKFELRKLESLQAEIEGLNTRIMKHEGSI